MEISWFFEKIHNIRNLVIGRKKERDLKLPASGIQGISTDPEDMTVVIRKYCEQFRPHTFGNLMKMDQFYNIPPT